jgi:predicted acetyltransferase
LEIRPIRLDELEEYVRLDAYAFGYEPTEEVMARYRTYLRPEETLAAFESGRMVAHLVAYHWRMAINGGSVPMGGIADVAVWPEARRAGHAGALLRACLTSLRDRGLPLSMLHPSFYALYYRFGWALAAESRTYTFRPVDLRFRTPAPTDGSLERLAPEDWRTIAGIYQRSLPSCNGAILRGDAEWTGLVLSSAQAGPPRQIVVWRDGEGEPQGYLVHRYPIRIGDFATTLYDQEIAVRELVAFTPAAYRGLLEYLARHDLAERVRWPASPHDPFLSLLADPSIVKIETRPDMMLRVVDLVPALELRTYMPGPPTCFVLRLVDPSAPWNDGTWRIEVEAGKARVKPDASEPDISANAGVLAALYNGFLTPSQAMRSGLLDARDTGALAAATGIFRVSAPPFCADYF